MKFLVRWFFRSLRRLLGPVMLAGEWLTRPRGIVRSAAEQACLDARTRHLALYQFRTCPFCIKVRHTLARRRLNIELRDAQHDPLWRRELEQLGGQIKVPCLRIDAEDGGTTWLYESTAINRYLESLACDAPGQPATP